MVVQSTANAMGAKPVNINNISYLQKQYRTPKAGVSLRQLDGFIGGTSVVLRRARTAGTDSAGTVI